MEITFLALLALQFVLKLLFAFRYLYSSYDTISKAVLASGLYCIELLAVAAIAGSCAQFNISFISAVLAASFLLQLVALAWLNHKGPKLPNRQNSLCLGSLLIITLAAIFYLPPSQIVIGGQDPSLYVAAASTLAKYENPTVPLKAHKLFSPEERHEWFNFKEKSKDYYWPYGGVYVFNEDSPHYQFDFLRGPSYLLALAFLATDSADIWAQRAFLVNTVYSVIAIFCFYLLLQSFFKDKLWPFLATSLLLFCPSEIWFGRANYSEVPSQFFIFFGLLHLSLIEKQKTKNYFCYLAVAILSITGALLMRPDHLSIVLVLIVLLPFYAIVSPLSAKQTFAGQLLLTGLFALSIYEFEKTGPLYLWRMGRESIVLKEMHLFVFGSLVFSLVFYLKPLTTFLIETYRKLEPILFSKKTLTIYSLAILALLGWGFIYRILDEPFQHFGPNSAHNSNARTMNEQIFFRLSVMVGFPIFVLSFWGIRTFFLNEKSRLAALVILILLTAYSSQLLISQKNSPMLYWATRRYLPVLVPFFIFFGTYQLSRIKLFANNLANKSLQFAAFAVAIIPMIFVGRHLYWQGEMNGAMTVVEELQTRLDNKTTVLLADKSHKNKNFNLQFIGGFEVLQLKGLDKLSSETEQRITQIVERLHSANLNVAIVTGSSKAALLFARLQGKRDGTIIHPYRRLGETMEKFPDSPAIKNYKVYYRVL